MSSAMKIEIADLKSHVLELKGTIRTITSEQKKDKTSISALEKCVHELSVDLNKKKQMLEKQIELTKTVRNNIPQTPSLFENIKRQNQNGDRQQPKTQTLNIIPASTTEPKDTTDREKDRDRQVQNEIQINDTVINQIKDNQHPIVNTKDTNDSTAKSDTNKSVSENGVQREIESPSSKFEGNYSAAVTFKSNTEQTHDENTSSKDPTNDIKRFGTKRDLYMYFNEDGQPRFGRVSTQHVSETHSRDTTSEHGNENSYEQTDQNIEDDSENDYSSPPKQIPVRYTNRYQLSHLTNRNESKSKPQRYQNRTTNFPTKPSQHNENAHQTTDTNTYTKEKYTFNETASFGQKESEEPIFEGIVRRKTIRYYIGNIGQKSNRAGMIKFLKVYDVEPVGVRIIETFRGLLSAKITVYASDRYKMESGITWPKKMYCRRWYGMQQWNAKSEYDKNYNDNYNNDNYNNDYEASGVD